MGFEMGPSPEQQMEVQEMNRGYNVMNGVKEKLQSKDVSGAEVELKQIKAVEKFVDQNLPALSQEQKASPDGFYSPAHMMANATRLVEQVVSEKREADMPKAASATDQAMRLMAFGMYEKNKSVHDVSGRVRYENFKLPNIVEIPGDWKQTPDGQDFPKKLKEFIERRKQNKPVEQSDFESLNSMAGLIGKSYKGKTIDKKKAEQVPYARELILINLELLASEAKKHNGKQLPGSEENVNTFQLIRGLYNYNEGAELEQQLRPGVQFFGLPKIVEQPGKLRT